MSKHDKQHFDVPVGKVLTQAMRAEAILFAETGKETSARRLVAQADKLDYLCLAYKPQGQLKADPNPQVGTLCDMYRRPECSKIESVGVTQANSRNPNPKKNKVLPTTVESFLSKLNDVDTLT